MEASPLIADLFHLALGLCGRRCLTLLPRCSTPDDQCVAPLGQPNLGKRSPAARKIRAETAFEAK